LNVPLLSGFSTAFVWPENSSSLLRKQVKAASKITKPFFFFEIIKRRLITFPSFSFSRMTIYKTLFRSFGIQFPF